MNFSRLEEEIEKDSTCSQFQTAFQWPNRPETNYNMMHFGSNIEEKIIKKPKRKLLEIGCGVRPAKQLITEEHMSAHLNNLHLSSDFINHELSPSQQEAEEQEMNVGITPDLEEMLKTANKITVCEEVRKLTSVSDIIPKILLDKMKSPCTALVLWQPKKPIPEDPKNLFFNSSTNSGESSKKNQKDSEFEIEYEISRTSTTFTDNSMDNLTMDLDS